MSQLSGTVAGRFQIDRLAGAGGMGSVYRAWDQHTGAVIALKVMHPHLSGQAERFGREAKLLSELDHPGIVRVVDFGRLEDGQRYLAMEWLDGESLSQRLERQLLSVAEAVRVGQLVATALGTAHVLGVVHRDLKPDNIFLVDGATERVKIVDFGVARLLTDQGDKLTYTGAMLGTPAYMAPEQVEAATTVGPPADVYALGGVLVMCLTGRYLFPDESPIAMAIKALTEQPPSLASLRQDVPPALDAAVARFLAKSAADRPADGHAAAQVLGAVLAGGGPAAGVPVPAAAASHAHCLVMARPPGADAPALRLSDVQAVAAQHGGTVHVLPDGTTIVLFGAAGALAEQVARGAHCALSLQGLAPGMALAVVAEQTAVDQTPPGSGVAGMLLSRAQPQQIMVNEQAAALLGPPFDVRPTPQGSLLCGLLVVGPPGHGAAAAVSAVSVASHAPAAQSAVPAVLPAVVPAPGAAAHSPVGAGYPVAAGPGAPTPMAGAMAQQPPAQSSRIGLWLLLAAVVIGLVGGSVVLVGGGYLQQDGAERRSAARADDDRQADEGKSKSKSKRDDESGSGSAEPRVAAAKAKPGATRTSAGQPGSPPTPTPPKAEPTATAAPKASTRNVGGAKGVVQECWIRNEGMVGGSAPASSATITVMFGANGVRGVAVGGPAAQYSKFQHCTVRRLTSHRWGKGDEASVTFSVGLAASPPK